MPGRDRLKEIAHEAVKDLVAEANHLANAADRSWECSEAYVAEHAERAHASIDKAAEACRILVKEG